MSWKVDVKHDLKAMKINFWKKQDKSRNECKRITEKARTHTRDVALKKQTKKTTKKEEEEEEEEMKKKEKKTKKKEKEEEKKKIEVLKIQVFSDVTPCPLVNYYLCLRR